MFKGVKEILINNQGEDLFTLVDSTHPINIYIGKDDTYRSTLFILSPFKPLSLKSSTLIDANIGVRKDTLWGISLSLNDINFLDLFCHFCDDIIQSSRHITDVKKGILFICQRYEQWQKMLKMNAPEILPKNSIKGILGELMFLKNILIPKYGQSIAIASWLGPEMLPQDFICDAKWFEIKSISSNSSSVTISSLEQLDVEFSGELLIVYLDSASNSFSEKLVINQYYNNLLSSINLDEDKISLTNKLLEIGFYPREEYNEYVFKFTKCVKYEVNKHFPCLRKSEIPVTVISAKYEISLPSINKYQLEVMEEWT